MPLPMMAGDPATMMSQPGMQGAPPPAPGAGEASPATVDLLEQLRGAIEVLSKMRTGVSDTLEAVATQFPPIAKSAQAMLQSVDAQMKQLVRELNQTTQTPEPAAPRVVR